MGRYQNATKFEQFCGGSVFKSEFLLAQTCDGITNLCLYMIQGINQVRWIVGRMQNVIYLPFCGVVCLVTQQIRSGNSLSHSGAY